MTNQFIYGRDETQGVVSIEDADGTLEVFREGPEGVQWQALPHSYWALAPEQYSSAWERLEGNGFYKYRRRYKSRRELFEDKRRHTHIWCVYDPREAALMDTGITYFKGLKVDDVSVLAFDIETTGLTHDSDSRVLLISNTFRRAGITERKLFAYDEYPNQAALFQAWTAWVRERNPSLLVGHNIFSFDLPYLSYCAHLAGTELELGRDGSPLWFNNFESSYRRDGSQFYEYTGANVYGREIVDTFFLAMKYDFSRKYVSYGLKAIIEAEGLQVAGRQFYDAGQISANYRKSDEWRKIKAYAEHDADDALALYDLMIPAYFYLCQSVPRSLQHLICTASGAWLNGFLIRSYLQENHSVPVASQDMAYEGAISIGNPGIYRNVFKADVASLYPSIILQYGIHDPEKDPRGHFLQMAEHFVAERLTNKRLAKETGDRHYSDLEQAQKIVINSMYGLLGAPGLHFNSPANGARVTAEGRTILTMAMEWAREAGYQLVNADTDSVSIAQNGLAVEWDWVLAELNARSPERIRWEYDGVYDSVLVLKAKNYVMRQGDKLKIKGSALKATPKEAALREFIQQMVKLLLDGNQARAPELYWQYVREILSLTDIKRWVSKRTVTSTIYTSERTNETKVKDALAGSDYRIGDKCYLYFTDTGALKLAERWTQDHDSSKLLKKLFDTVQIFETVLDTEQFPNLTLKRNKSLFLTAV